MATRSWDIKKRSKVNGRERTEIFITTGKETEIQVEEILGLRKFQKPLGGREATWLRPQ